MEASRVPPFRVASKAKDKEEKISDSTANSEMSFEQRPRPTKQYVPALPEAPRAPKLGIYDEDTSMTGYLHNEPYFNNVHACPNAVLHPKGPPYMLTHLRTIGKHFNDPSCYITTDNCFHRDASDLSSLPTNYPWLFKIEIYHELTGGFQLISTRHFFRDLEGEVGTRPYVEVTKLESLEFLRSEFVEVKERAGLWMCKAEEPWGHFEHWGRQYVVKFLKKKQRPNPDQSPNFASKGNNWSFKMPVG